MRERGAPTALAWTARWCRCVVVCARRPQVGCVLRRGGASWCSCWWRGLRQAFALPYPLFVCSSPSVFVSCFFFLLEWLCTSLIVFAFLPHTFPLSWVVTRRWYRWSGRFRVLPPLFEVVSHFHRHPFSCCVACGVLLLPLSVYFLSSCCCFAWRLSSFLLALDVFGRRHTHAHTHARNMQARVTTNLSP